MSDKLNFAIGFRWNEADEDSSIGLYSYYGNHWHGDMNTAKDTLELVKKQDKTKVFRIYKLMEVV